MESNEFILRGPPLKTEFPKNGIGCMIFEACDKYAKKICHISPDLVNLDESCSETYASFKDRTSRVAQELLHHGLQSNDFLVNCCPNTFNNMLTTAACFYIGGIPATMDPTLSDRDCAHLLHQMQPKFIFVHEASIKLIEDALDIAKLPTNPLMVVYGKNKKYLTFDTFLEKPANGFTPMPQTNLDATAIMLYSSGSTGLAKGICITHRLLFAGALNFLDLLDDASCMLHYSTFYWISAVLVFIAQFINGGCRVAARQFNDEEPCKTISKHKVTGVFLASSYAYQMQHSLEQQLIKYNISSLKTIIFAGGPVSDVQIKRIRAWLPGVNVFIGYGMSEAAAFVTGFDATARKKYVNYASSCGLPLSGTEIKFVDPETEKALGPNETGELRYKICGKFNGYYGHPDENTYDSNGYFKSGDLGYHNDEGLVFICDRIRDMFKYMCWHIVPVAIELIINEHASVLESVVFGIPHEEAENLPAAAVVLRNGCKATSDEIINFVAARTIDRHRLRGGVYIVDKLTKTPSVLDLIHLINIAKPKLMFVDYEYLPLMEAALARIEFNIQLIINSDYPHSIRNGRLLSDLLVQPKGAIEFTPIRIDNEDSPAAILYSSGTTGLLKGILLSHVGLYNSAILFRSILNEPYIYDRIKDIFKYKLCRIVPASIEVVIKTHPAVEEAVVFGIPDKDGHLPAAAVKLNMSQNNISADEIAQYVSDNVADNQTLRGGVYIIDKIDCTPSGKVQRRKE